MRGLLLCAASAIAFLAARGRTLQPESHILLLRNASVVQAAQRLCGPADGCRAFATALHGLAVRLPRPALGRLMERLGDGVMHVERDARVARAEGPPARRWRRLRKAARVEGAAEAGTSRRLLQSSPAPGPAVGIAESPEAADSDVTEGPNTDPSYLALEAALEATATVWRGSGLPNVSSLEEAGPKAQRLLTKATWGLDRIDQRSPQLDSQYRFGTAGSPGTGRGVTLYVLDSGVRISHQEFQPWDGGAGRATLGANFVDGADDNNAMDCDGHGTHVASTAAGRLVGVAKEASIVAVRVLDCSGGGSISDTVAGLDWIAQHATAPAVVTLSLGVPSGTWSRALATAITSLMRNHGLTVVVASGNASGDGCQEAPASVNGTLVVAASDLASKLGISAGGQGNAEAKYEWANTGRCVDVFAPGVDILGACGGHTRCASLSDSAYTWATGTSMAVPYVAGVAALYLEAHPSASPAEVGAAITAAATQGALQERGFLPGTPNLLLYSRGVLAPGGPAPPVTAFGGGD